MHRLVSFVIAAVLGSTGVTGNYAALLTGVARLSIGERIGFAA
jgi:hypothetical protein